MTVSTPEATVAKIPIEDAAQDTLNFVMARIRQSLGSAYVAEMIYGNSKVRHARSVLIGAITLSHGTKNLDTTKILNSLRAIDRCGAYDFETMEEFWSLIEDTARDQARECREYAATCLADHGDAP